MDGDGEAAGRAHLFSISREIITQRAYSLPQDHKEEELESSTGHCRRSRREGYPLKTESVC